MTEAVVIIDSDSSDDESSNQPMKKMKLDDDISLDFKITDVKSLAEPTLPELQPTEDIIEIDSDDNCSEKENEKVPDTNVLDKFKLDFLKTLSNHLTITPILNSKTTETVNTDKTDIIERVSPILNTKTTEKENVKVVVNTHGTEIIDLNENDDTFKSLSSQSDEVVLIEPTDNNIAENNIKKCMSPEQDNKTAILRDYMEKKNIDDKSTVLESTNNLTSTNIEEAASPVNLSSPEETPFEGTSSAKDNNLCLSEEELLKSPEPEQESTDSIELQEFIKLCISDDIPTKYKNLMSVKVVKLQEKYKESDPMYKESKAFKKIVNSSIEKLKANPKNVLVYYKIIYDELKVNKHKDINLTVKQDIHLSKLNKAMINLDKKIRELEDAEVDFDEDNDSAYIQLERYKQRFVQVHKKYCQILKKDAYACRMTHRKLDFSASKYVEINRAIDRLYTKEKKFPLFDEVDDCVRNAIKSAKLNLSETEIVLEVRKMLKEMGSLIQRRRRLELDDVHNVFLGNEPDPATVDQKLKEQLDQQLVEANKKMEAVFEMYTKKQLDGENPAVSSDSDDSNIQSDEEKPDENLVSND